MSTFFLFSRRIEAAYDNNVCQPVCSPACRELFQSDGNTIFFNSIFLDHPSVSYWRERLKHRCFEDVHVRSTGHQLRVNRDVRGKTLR